MARQSKESHVKSSMKYNDTHTMQLSMKLNLETDADVISHLDQLQESKRGYILRLIREDMAKGDQ